MQRTPSRLSYRFLPFLAWVGFAMPAAAAPDLPAASPRAKVEQRVGITDFSIEYSSPAVRGRTIWGELVPWGEVWRAGADASTVLTASRDFRFGDALVPAGSYALLAIPSEKNWTLILSTQRGVTSTAGHDPTHDVARAKVEAKPMAEARERLTFLFSDATADSVSLDLEWEKLRVRVPLAVDTEAHVLAEIDRAVAQAWRPHFASARWLLDNDGDLDKALEYIEASIAIQATWWNHWVKAQIHAKRNEAALAHQSAVEAQRLGKGERIYEGFYKETIAEAVAKWSASL